MFLVEDSRHRATFLVFTWEDPRKDGFEGKQIDDVVLDYDLEIVNKWSDGQAEPEECVGISPENPKRYKVFRYREDLDSAGYEWVPGEPVVFGRWGQYLKVRLEPPNPQHVKPEQWYAFLDKLDEDARTRRRHPLPEPRGGNRDDVAAWLARTHLVADSSIREVWYLPRGAAPDEIRLLELNDRLAGSETESETLDFGVDVQGARFRLSVADVTTDGMEAIRSNPDRLPSGWSLDEGRVWRRGA